MHALAINRIQIGRKRCNQRLTLTCSHLGNFTTMEHNTADHLNVEMAHSGDALGCFTNRCKRLWKDVVKRLARSQSFAEQLGLVLEFFVRQRDHPVLERIDLCDDFHRLFDITVVGRTEDGLGDSAEHGQTSEIYG